MTSLDLTKVPPLHLSRALARAAAVQAYITSYHRNGAERDRIAAELGISPAAFLRLVQAWKAGKGAKGLGSHAKSDKPRKLTRAREITSGAIALHGATSSLKVIKATVLAQCAKEQVRPPSRATIHNHLMEARAEAKPTHLEPMIVAGEVLIRLPCTTAAGDLDRLKLVLAAEVTSRRILGYRATMAEASSDYKTLLQELRQLEPDLPLLVDKRMEGKLGPIDTLGPTTYETSARIRQLLIHTFGAGLPGFGFVYRQGSAATVQSLVKRKSGRTIHVQAALEALEGVIARHNRDASQAAGAARLAA